MARGPRRWIGAAATTWHSSADGVALRWLGFALGIVLWLSTARSIIGGLIVPRAVTSKISRACDSMTDAAFRLATMPLRSFNRRDTILAWQGPVFIVTRLAVWVGLLYLTWALILLPFVAG